MRKIRRIIVAIALLLLSGAVSWSFWKEDWKYLFPTPVPVNYRPVETGARIYHRLLENNEQVRPLFLHFFNPACACSQFNMPHFKKLMRTYSTQVDFAVVVINAKKEYTQREIQNMYGMDVKVYFDKSIADSCGVYSTPQAAIIDSDGRLYYRGNYNRSRFCTEKETNYAEIAMDSLLSKCRAIQFEPSATTSYGCELSICKK